MIIIRLNHKLGYYKSPQEIFESKGIKFKCRHCFKYYMKGKMVCPKCGNKWDK